MDEEEPKHQNLEELENLRGCSTKQGKQDSDSVFTIFVDNLKDMENVIARTNNSLVDGLRIHVKKAKFLV
ncbi:hypothetical protein V6N11_064866 [Hibiscus sabdariffa]|uniref:Uncharacterized protein n=1 Tax=Hibiscus sabdariffa TaxID=183260 RepID=A0ABR2SI49_9ROSI